MEDLIEIVESKPELHIVSFFSHDFEHEGEEYFGVNRLDRSACYFLLCRGDKDPEICVGSKFGNEVTPEEAAQFQAEIDEAMKDFTWEKAEALLPAKDRPKRD